MDGLTKKASEDIILRNDFAFISLYSDLKNLEKNNKDFGTDTPLLSIFPDSERVEKWNQFRELTNLNIPDLEQNSAISWIYISMVGIIIVASLFLIFTDGDLTFFTMLHPEILGIGFIAIITLIVGIDYLVKKIKPNNQIPYSVNSKNVKGFIGRILTYNRHKIKEEFAEIYNDKFEEVKTGKTHYNTGYNSLFPPTLN